MYKNYLLLFVIFIVLLSSCSKLENQSEDLSLEKTEIGILSFESIEEFQNVMDNLELGIETKSTLIPHLSVNLFSKSSSVDYENDPILKYDMHDYFQTKSSTDDSSIYEAAGYENLVPDEVFASVLNARGEVKVGGNIYKISPKGTYVFNESIEDIFNDNYSIFEESKGEMIDSMTFKLTDGIIRYSTFKSDAYTFYAEGYEEDVEYNENDFETKAPVFVSSLQNLDYSRYPRYCSDAHTLVGKLLQSLFGSNKTFEYYFSNNRRFSANFYYYDYIIWSSIGTKTNMQKKPLLFWKDEQASEIYVGWSNIITKTELKGNILEYPAKIKQQMQVVTNKEKDTYNGKEIEVAYVFGLTLTEDALANIVGQGLKSVLKAIQSGTKQDVSTADKLFLVGPQSYYTFYLDDGAKAINTSLLNKTFYKSFSIGASFDLLNLPTGWLQWTKSIAKTTYDLPNTTLYSGEIRTAVRYNNTIGAVSIYKNK